MPPAHPCSPPTTAQDAPDNPAQTLDLLQPDNPDHMFLLQMPASLPLARQQEEQAAGPSRRGPSASSKAAAANSKGASVRELPSGKMGKLLVFQSGKIKLQIGDVLLDVSSGTPLQTRQDVAALNVREGHCVLLGDLATRMVLCPDVMQLITDSTVPDFERGELPQANGGTHKGRLAGKGAAAKAGGSEDEDMMDDDDEDVPAAKAGAGKSKAGSDDGEDEDDVGKLRRKVHKQVKLADDDDEDMEDDDS